MLPLNKKIRKGESDSRKEQRRFCQVAGLVHGSETYLHRVPPVRFIMFHQSAMQMGNLCMAFEKL